MTKYLYREHGGYAFRVRLQNGRDSILGPYVYIKIQEAKPAPRNKLDGFIQWWAVKTYTSGTWYAFKDSTLEQAITHELNYVVKNFENEIKFAKEWSNCIKK